MGIEIHGYETWDFVEHRLDEPAYSPDDLHGVGVEDLYRVLVHVTDESGDPERDRYFWANAMDSFDDWESWIIFIGDLADAYGISVA